MNEEKPYIIELARALNKASYTDIKLLAEKVGVDPSQYEYKYKLVEGITRKIGTRTTRPGPAADAIDRAAKAIESVVWELGLESMIAVGHARVMARAALQSAAVEPEPGLDAVSRRVRSLARSCLADAYELGRREGEANMYGTGAGVQMDRMANQIAAAVRQAKENGDG